MPSPPTVSLSSTKRPDPTILSHRAVEGHDCSQSNVSRTTSGPRTSCLFDAPHWSPFEASASRLREIRTRKGAVVDQTGARWNQLVGWLHQLAALRGMAS
jgi:hypothetical protein